MLLASNTLHKVHDAIADATGLPILHIADPTAERLVADGVKRIGLIGTRFTMAEDFVCGRIEQRGITIAPIAAHGAREIDRIIYEELAAADRRQDPRDRFPFDCGWRRGGGVRSRRASVRLAGDDCRHSVARGRSPGQRDWGAVDCRGQERVRQRPDLNRCRQFSRCQRRGCGGSRRHGGGLGLLFDGGPRRGRRVRSRRSSVWLASEGNRQSGLAAGHQAVAGGVQSTAVGKNANAAFDNSTALGFGATTTATNQVAFGGTGSSVRVGDIAASTAAQTGTIAVATVDGNGTLGRNTTLFGTVATQGTSITKLQAGQASQAGMITNLQSGQATLFDVTDNNRRETRKANEGVAMALAMDTPSIPAGERMAVSGGVGYFNNRTALASAVSVTVGEKASVSAGLSYGFNAKEVGARAGFQVACKSEGSGCMADGNDLSGSYGCRVDLRSVARERPTSRAKGPRAQATSQAGVPNSLDG